MTPLLALGIKVGMGAIAGHKMAMRVMRPKRGLGQLPPVGVRGLGDIRVALRPPAGINYTNGLHFAQAAQTMLNRGDLQNARNNILAAYTASGMSVNSVNAPHLDVVSIQGWITAYMTAYRNQRYGRQTVMRPPQPVSTYLSFG